MAGYRVSRVSSARSNAWPRFWVRNRNPSARCSPDAALWSLKTRSPADFSRSQKSFHAARSAASSGLSPNAIGHPLSAESFQHHRYGLTRATCGRESAFGFDAGPDQLEVEALGITACKYLRNEPLDRDGAVAGDGTGGQRTVAEYVV